jgi:uncharacterized membrane protein YkoI
VRKAPRSGACARFAEIDVRTARSTRLRAPYKTTSRRIAFIPDSSGAAYDAGMHRFAVSIFAVALAAAAVGVAPAAEPEQCLSVEERRAAIAAHKAVPVGRAIRAAKARHGGEVVRANLCDRDGLVYVLTVLARDGRVHRVTVDAASGRLTGGR